MKLRIRDNSLRLRLTQTEVAAIASGEAVASAAGNCDGIIGGPGLIAGATLEAGSYTVAVSGAGVLVDDGFLMELATPSPAVQGQIVAGSAGPAVFNVPAGGRAVFSFSIGSNDPCNAADLSSLPDGLFGVLDFNDINLFVELFLGGDLAADLSGDGSLSFFDIEAFVVAFLGGCP